MAFDEHYPEEAAALAAANIRHYRKVLGLSHVSLAERAGNVAVTQIIRAESGRNVTFRTMARISAGLGLTVSDLLREREE